MNPKSRKVAAVMPIEPLLKLLQRYASYGVRPKRVWITEADLFAAWSAQPEAGWPKFTWSETLKLAKGGKVDYWAGGPRVCGVELRVR